MLSQWECFLKNLGEWHGSFTRLSPQGEETEDTPSIVTLEAKQDNQAVHQVVRYLPKDQPPRDLEVNYNSTSLNRSILFFEDGAFCQGSMQWGPYSQFGAEFGLIEGDRRLRMVELYNSSSNISNIEKIVLIREKLPNSQTPERPPLTVNSLIGEWQGAAITMYADLRNPDTCSTHLKISQISPEKIEQTLSFGGRNLTSQAKIEGDRLLFETSNLPIQILLLPDGASCNCPLEIKLGSPFVLEMGWLLTPNRRKRIMRSFDEKGTWTSCTLVTETKI
jgi:hypothetical protein